MSYYEALGLKKEPFSTSPDPAFFYRSSAHSTAIQRLEIAIRLKRGLSVILGDVGIGKTTMSRALLQNFANDDSLNASNNFTAQIGHLSDHVRCGQAQVCFEAFFACFRLLSPSRPRKRRNGSVRARPSASAKRRGGSVHKAPFETDPPALCGGS